MLSIDRRAEVKLIHLKIYMTGEQFSPQVVLVLPHLIIVIKLYHI